MENKNQENLSKNKKINDNIYLNNNLDENKDINNKKPKEIQEEESESYNFLYEKINKNLKTPFFNFKTRFLNEISAECSQFHHFHDFHQY